MATTTTNGRKTQIPCPRYVPSCPRCGQPIPVGHLIEVIDTQVVGGKQINTWAHVNCKKQGVRIVNQVSGDIDAAPTIDQHKLDEQIQEAARKAVTESYKAVSSEVASQCLDNLRERVEEMSLGINLAVNGISSNLESQVTRAAEQTREELLAVAHSVRKVVVEIRHGDNTKIADSGEVFNEAFAEVMEMAADGENVFLPGPAGCGKTWLAEQVSKYIPNRDGTFGRAFGMISGSAGVTEAHLVGTSLPRLTDGANIYVPSAFVTIFEEGGVFLIDEADALDANVLLSINAALANGMFPVPKRTDKPIAKRHDSFVCILAANTYGRGADRQYVGRNKLDAATLDRFCTSMVPVTYSNEVEKRLCPDQEWYERMMQWREAIFANKMTRILSTRFVAGAARIKARGRDLAYLARKLTLDQGWTYDEAVKVLGDATAKAVGYKSAW